MIYLLFFGIALILCIAITAICCLILASRVDRVEDDWYEKTMKGEGE